jgi:hypothetical protein
MLTKSSHWDHILSQFKTLQIFTPYFLKIKDSLMGFSYVSQYSMYFSALSDDNSPTHLSVLD